MLISRNLFRIMVFGLLCISTSLAQPTEKTPALTAMDNLIIDMQWFLSYTLGTIKEVRINEFNIKRGYVNIKKTINEQFSGRITTDITLDREGDGEGDLEVRLKYLYLNYNLPNLGFLYNPYLEIGLVHLPWIDFEQYINPYRVQGTMFLERNRIVGSGDYGLLFAALLGGEMDKHYQSTVNKNFPGKYGSVAFGIFNGGGYHALEKNENKTLQGRLTLRPLPAFLPGLQFSVHGAYGKGNIPQSPLWQYASGYLSWEHRQVTLTAGYYHGVGNYEGSAIRDTVSYKALNQNGFSFFGDWRLFQSKISLFGRFDHFSQNYPDHDLIGRRRITGIAYHFIKGSKIIIDVDKKSYSKKGKAGSQIFEIAIELKY